MCELFAMSSRYPTDLTISFDVFARRGGGDAHHADGWGLGFFQGCDAQLLREPNAAVDSACVRMLHEHPVRSALLLAHVRRATRGPLVLANTQPFARELSGRMHLFAHNGHVPGVLADPRFRLGRFLPVGGTDSEHAFCALLSRLEVPWSNALPPLAQRLEVVTTFARELGEHGPANFLYADGDALFAHGHRRTQPSGAMAPPGLHVLCRTCAAKLEGVDMAALEPEQRVVLFASVPLSDEPWQPMVEGQVLLVREGQLVSGLSRAALMNGVAP
jgi:glutamine amidotransferase